MSRYDIGITINSRLADEEISAMLKPLSDINYTATRQLGRGSEGIVFMARNELDGKYVAIKVCNKEQCQNSLGELWYWAFVRHSNCLKIREKYSYNQLVYYVMEFTDNLTLLDWIQDQRTSRIQGLIPNEKRLIKWSRQLLLAINYLHERGLYHLDIKPDNIFLDRNWDLKLGDFGFLRSEFDKTNPVNLGCPGYMPPEGLKEKVPLTINLEKVDMWSTGATIYELFTGRVISGSNFILRSVTSLEKKNLMRNLKKNLPKVKSETPLYPGGQDLVLRLLEWAPENRPSAQEILRHSWLCGGIDRRITPWDNGLWARIYAYWASIVTAGPDECRVLTSHYPVELERVAQKRKQTTEYQVISTKRAKWTDVKHRK